MVPTPRNRSPKSATPRRQLVLKLNQIRCTECGVSGSVKYLRPFRAYQTHEGFLVFCRTCQAAQLPPPEKLEARPLVMAPATTLQSVGSTRAA